MLACHYSKAESKNDPEKYRFQVELEFVQCLANPLYLNCECFMLILISGALCENLKAWFSNWLHSSCSERLFQRERIYQLFGLSSVLEEARICTISKVRVHALWLPPWRKVANLYMIPECCIFLVRVRRYPQCLHFLDLLQSEHFRRELANAQCTKFIEEQQLLHWHYYTKRRMLFQERISKCRESLVEVLHLRRLWDGSSMHVSEATSFQSLVVTKIFFSYLS